MGASGERPYNMGASGELLYNRVHLAKKADT
jgi:hypothetical protein